MLKGHDNETDFVGFLPKLIPYESLTLPFGPFRFGLRIRGDIHIRKTTPRYHRSGVSPTPRITDTRSRRLPASSIRRVGYWIFVKKTLRIENDMKSRRLPAPVIRWVTDSPYRWVADSAYHRYRESTIPHIVESGSRRLRGSVIRESLFEEKINLVFIFRAFNR